CRTWREPELDAIGGGLGEAVAGAPGGVRSPPPQPASTPQRNRRTPADLWSMLRLLLASVLGFGPRVLEGDRHAPAPVLDVHRKLDSALRVDRVDTQSGNAVDRVERTPGRMEEQLVDVVR